MCRRRFGPVAVFCVAALALTVTAQAGWAQASDATVTIAEPEEAQLLVVAPFGGFGKFNETTIAQDDAFWSAGLGLRWHPDVNNRATGEFQVQGYTREYVQVGVGTPGSPQRVAQDELRIEGAANWGYDVLSTLDLPLAFWPFVGWRHVYFTNDLFSRNLSGIEVGGQFEWSITQQFALVTSVDYTYNLAAIIDPVDTTASSVTGDVIGGLRWGAGFRIQAAERAEIGVSYAGEHLPYDNTDLFFHKAILEIGIPIRF